MCITIPRATERLPSIVIDLTNVEKKPCIWQFGRTVEPIILHMRDWAALYQERMLSRESL